MTPYLTWIIIIIPVLQEAATGKRYLPFPHSALCILRPWI